MGMRITSGQMAAGSTGAAAWQQRQQAFGAMAQALKSGDLDAAKTAYASLTGGGNGAPGGSGPLAQIGKALQSGDLAAAQQAMASMRSHHRHHHDATAGTTPAAPAATPTATPAPANPGGLLSLVA